MSKLKRHIENEEKAERETQDYKEVKRWKLSTNLPLLYDKYSSLSELEADMDEYNSIPVDLQIISDDKSVALFGKNNRDRYREMRHDFLIKPNKDFAEYRPLSQKVKYIDPINMILMMRECAESGNPNSNSWYTKYLSLSESYNPPASYNYFQNHIKEVIEIVRECYYSDNDWDGTTAYFPMYLPNEIPVEEASILDGAKEWKKAYASLFDGAPTKDYTSVMGEWKDAISTLYDGYKNAEDSEEANEYKKRILGLGWNVELMPPTPENIYSHKSRVMQYIKNLHSNIPIFDITRLNFPDIEEDSGLVPMQFVCCSKNDDKYEEIYLSKRPDFADSCMLAKKGNTLFCSKPDKILQNMYYDIYAVPNREVKVDPDIEESDGLYKWNVSSNPGSFKFFIHKLNLDGPVYKIFSGQYDDINFKDLKNKIKYVSITDKMNKDFDKVQLESAGIKQTPFDEVMTYGEIKELLKSK